MTLDVREVLDRFTAAFNVGVDEFVACHTEDVVHVTAPEWPEAGIYRGRENVRLLWAQIFEVHESLSATVEDMTELDEDRWLARTTLEARGIASGLTTRTTVFAVGCRRGDLVERIEYFLDESEARAAAGLDTA